MNTPSDALRARIIKKDPSAYGLLADAVRANGGKYAQVFSRVCFIFNRAGIQPPSPGEFDALLSESEEVTDG